MTALTVDVKLTTPSGFSLEVAFDAPEGVTVIFGPSGSGKSRTLACIAGIVRPDAGRIALGDDVWFEGTTDLAIERRRIAYVFQSLALFPHMTALANVAYGLSRELSRQVRRDRARDLLSKMHVGHLERRRPRTFSGGEAQRVALARAFAMTPRVLLLDEPFSALDARTKGRLLEEVTAWADAAKLPTLLVTHAEDEARAIGERVLFLDGGRIVRRSTISSAFDEAEPGPGSALEA